MNKCGKGRKLLLIIILWILFIWIHSMMPKDISTEESRGVFLMIERFLHMLNISDSLTEKIIRKLAHFCEYGMLGMLLSGYAWKMRTIISKFYMIFAAVFVPFIDETIQIFAEGRTSSVVDMWIDFAGYLCGLIFISTINLAISVIRSQKKDMRV